VPCFAAFTFYVYKYKRAKVVGPVPVKESLNLFFLFPVDNVRYFITFLKAEAKIHSYENLLTGYRLFAIKSNNQLSLFES